MIHCYLDASDLDEQPMDFARLEQNYRKSLEARAALVARLLGAQSPTNAVSQANVQSHMRQSAGEKGPSGL